MRRSSCAPEPGAEGARHVEVDDATLEALLDGIEVDTAPRARALQVREEPGGDVGGDRSMRQTCAVVVEELEALGVNVDAAADVHRERGAVGLRPGVERVESAGELLLGGMVHWMFSGCCWVSRLSIGSFAQKRGTRRSSTMRAPHCLEGSPQGKPAKQGDAPGKGRCAVSRRVEWVFPAGDERDGHRAVHEVGERGTSHDDTRKNRGRVARSGCIRQS